MTQHAHHTYIYKQIHPTFRQLLLSALPLDKQASMSAVIDTLIYASCARTSIHQTTSSSPHLPSGNTVRHKLAHAFDSLDLLEEKMNEIFARTLPPRLSKKKRLVIAIDYHEEPFYGTIHGPLETEITKSKAKDGTHKFFTYATSYLCHKGVRYTLAITRLCKGQTAHQSILKLMKYMKKVGIKPSLLMLDKGFYHAKTMSYLKRKKVPFIIPAILRGNAEKKAGLYAFLGMPRGYYHYVLNKKHNSQARPKLPITMCVTYQKEKNKEGKWYDRMLLFAVWGIGNKSVNWVKKSYKKRFGIESGYRQKNDSKVRSCSKNPMLKLWFFGMGLLTRQLWVWMHDEVLSTPRQGGRKLNSDFMRLGVLRAHLVRLIEIEYVFRWECPYLSEDSGAVERFKSRIESAVGFDGSEALR